MVDLPSTPAIDDLFTSTEWQKLVAALELSPRQAEILHLLLSGQCDKQIGLQLGISLSTVRTHLQRMYARFNVSDRTSLVVHVFRCFRGLSK